MGWGTDWSWQGGGGGVKSFVSLVYGWQWGTRIENTGLPVQIAGTNSIRCGWDFTINHTGTLNVSFDLFLHAVADPDFETDPTDEIMIWPYRAEGAGPIGSRQASVTIAGASWDLYRGPHPVWPNVFSFVRTENATSTLFDVMDFVRDLVGRGWVPDSKYISTIQTGSEVFNGNGSLQTHGFFGRID